VFCLVLCFVVDCVVLFCLVLCVCGLVLCCLALPSLELFSLLLSRPVLPCPVLPCPVLPCPVLPCPVLPYVGMLHLVSSYSLLICLSLPCVTFVSLSLCSLVRISILFCPCLYSLMSLSGCSSPALESMSTRYFNGQTFLCHSGRGLEWS
jgi:hypothetical protein